MKNRKKSSTKKASKKQIFDYDSYDVSSFIDENHPLKFEDLGLKLPDRPPTEVVSVRLPTELLNELRSLGSQRDIPYQALIKLFLSESVKRMQKEKR